MNFLDYANSVQTKFELGLERVSELLSRLGDPQKGMRYIHVAGTNGKGSVCEFLNEIFIAAKYRTGKYTSPNLIRVNERITVDNEEIPDYALTEIMAKVEEAARSMRDMPTQFELWTAAAFLWFKHKRCDIIILEVGLGGRLDATNVIENPLCSVITPISIDHTDYLGDTLEKIALEKAGIIKRGCPVITTAQQADAAKAIERTAHERESDLFITDRATEHAPENMHECFDYKDLKGLVSGIGGVCQLQNAPLAIEAARLCGIGDEHIREGLKNARHLARFEVISEKPLVIFDGAHNAGGAASLAASVKRYLGGKKIAYIYGAMHDKDIEGVLKELPEGDFYFVTVDSPRAESAEKIALRAKSAGVIGTPCESVDRALDGADADAAIICGSLYLYKQAIIGVKK